MIGIIGFVIFGLGLLAVGLQRLYSAVPLRELKRVAATGDYAAKRLYMVAAYGESARLLLWVIAAAGLAGGTVLLDAGLPRVLALVLLVSGLLAAMVWMPSIGLSRPTCQLAVWMAPGLAWVLAELRPALQGAATVLNRHRRLVPHSRLYEKSDLQALFERQQNQHDNRIAPQDLERAKRALMLSDRRATDVLLPRKDVRLVNAHESIGPILMGELHKAGQGCLPVIDEQSQELVGTIAVQDAVAHARQGSSTVADIMHAEICFVHEDYSLLQTLEALLRTRQPLAVVVNSFEEFVGVVDLQKLVADIVAAEDTDDNKVNDLDRTAVARFAPKADQTATQLAEPDADLPVSEFAEPGVEPSVKAQAPANLPAEVSDTETPPAANNISVSPATGLSAQEQQATGSIEPVASTQALEVVE